MRISADLRILFKCFQWVIFLTIMVFEISGFAETKKFQEAEALAKQEKWQEVVDLLKTEAVSLDRKSKLLLTQAYQKTKNTAGQIQILNSLIAENEKDFESHTLLGNTYLEKNPKNFDEAALHFRNALAAKKGYLPAYQGLLRVYEETKNTYELRILYQDMIKLMGEKPEFVSALCRIDAQDGYLETARKWCNKGMMADPKNGDNQVYLGIVLKDAGDESQSIQILKKAADTYENSDFAQLKYAEVLAEKKDHLGAFKYFQKAAAANPKSAAAWDGLAHSALETQNYKISANAFENACKLDHKVLPKVRKALALMRRTDEKEHTRTFEKVASECGLQK
jgi:tetratricopeptide (TPR) repeat protein